MSTYEILPAGVKLKNLREKYKLLQDDLAGSEITRNLISQIEHGKARLTRHVAEIMFKNLKEICHRRNIKIDEDIDSLIEDEQSQANKIIDKYIKQLRDLFIYKNGLFQNKLAEVEKFMINWDIKDKKIIIFELAGDYYCNINDLQTSLIYYEKAKTLIDLNMNNDDIVSILRKLSIVYFYIGKYEKDIECCNFALENFKNMSEEYYCVFLYNSSLCYIKLKEYELSLRELKKLESILKEINIDKYYEILGQQGVCFQYLKEYEKSIEIYNKILISMNKNNYQSCTTILLNLADIYIDISDFNTAKEYLECASENIKNIRSSNYISEKYYKLSTLYKKIDIKKAELLYVKALEYAKRYKRYNIIKNILNDLFDIYIINKNDIGIVNIKNAFFMLMEKGNKVNNLLRDKIIEYYLDKKDISSLREIHNFVKVNMKGSDNFVF